MDVEEMPEIRGPAGLLPKTPIYLVVGYKALEWSAAGVRDRKQSGFLYFWDPLSPMNDSNVWSFAACKLSSLADLTANDLKVDFCEAEEVEKGLAAFGTNWVHDRGQVRAVLVRQGQVILARHSKYPTNIYALEMTEQNSGNLRVRYVEVAR